MLNEIFLFFLERGELALQWKEWGSVSNVKMGCERGFGALSSVSLSGSCRKSSF